jgi:hypothetical protein
MGQSPAASATPVQTELKPMEPAKNFGLSATQRQPAPPQELPEIHAQITEVRIDQLRRARLVLNNGQVWASLEGETLLEAGEAVTIKRAALGSFMLVSASKHVYRVRRLH